MVKKRIHLFCVCFVINLSAWCCSTSRAEPLILNTSDLNRYVAEFNQLSGTPADSAIPNEFAAQWMAANIPLFDCPDEQLEKIYYFRWWTYRKHIRNTPQGRVITEFLTPVGHAGPYNTISCAFGHHLAEGRWLRDQQPLDEYTHFWFRSGPNDGRAEHFHKYSSWAATALYNRFLVTGDRGFLIDLLDDLVADYKQWEAERQNADGLFWQYDVRDGMEESISGDRHKKHIRPTINSYMAASACAIAQAAGLAGRPELERAFNTKAEEIRNRMIGELWDPDAKFFKVKFEAPPVAESLRDSDKKSAASKPEIAKISDAREAIGFIPWTFNLADPSHAEAWKQLRDPRGFWAPRGLTTAEQRHPKFRTHGTGTCEWDGAVWPFATSQTLTGLANYLHRPRGLSPFAESAEKKGTVPLSESGFDTASRHPFATKRDFFDAMQIYAASHTMDGKPYIGEYHDHETGQWLITGPKAERSRDYNHSTFCDLVITGLVGLIPRDGNTIEVHPLIPKNTWTHFCLDNIPYHGQVLTIVWDQSGTRYNHGQGLAIWSDGQEIARSARLTRLQGILPKRKAD